jgi:hypothetical protein
MRICAAPGCDNAVPLPRRGRPAVYCSPTCRPSRGSRPSSLTVEVDHPEECSDGRAVARVWTVSLRRGRRRVVVAEDLGWPSANALASALDDLITPRPRRKGGAIE